MHFLRTNFDGDPNLGLYGFATDKYCFIGGNYSSKVKETLKVPAHSFTLLNMDLVRIFVTGNSSGVAVPGILRDVDPEHLEKIKRKFDVIEIDSRYTSVGNLILMNDNGIILSPLLKKHRAGMEKFFGVPCRVSTIAKMNVVGNLGFATNKGCLVHPKIKESEKKLIEKTLDIDVDITTVSFGSPYPGAGLIANKNGFIVSESTSGHELGRISDVLGFL